MKPTPNKDQDPKKEPQMGQKEKQSGQHEDDQLEERLSGLVHGPSLGPVG